MGEVIALIDPKKTINRADRFGLMLDDKLPTFPTDWSRKTFLTALLHNWETRYRHFLERCANPDPTYDPGEASAWDYAMTISEISVRLAKYERARQS